jgi:hypothetical protein
VKDGILIVPAGKPMTLARFSQWQARQLPVTHYTLTFQAKRHAGDDFFAAMTFPCGSLQTCLTLMLGGWGGDLCGISSLDGKDASENEQRSSQTFRPDHWHDFRLEVRPDTLQVWMDERRIVNASLTGRTLSLRPGDIELCAPFGFASYWTEGHIRQLSLTPLTSAAD